jgi:DNA-binding helix-hairpin-helix protein with protein kinase domain
MYAQTTDQKAEASKQLNELKKEELGLKSKKQEQDYELDTKELERKKEADKNKFEISQKLAQSRSKIAALQPDKKAKLNATEMQRYDNSRMALEAAIDMQDALTQGFETQTISREMTERFAPSLLKYTNTNPYIAARDAYVEALARMQTGGAITTREEEMFKGFVPLPGDSPEIRELKLTRMQHEMSTRLKSLRATDEDIEKIKQTTPGKLNQQSSVTKPKPTPNGMTVKSVDEFKAAAAKKTPIINYGGETYFYDSPSGKYNKAK